MTGASWCDENLVSATRSYWLLSWWESWVTTINMNSKIWYFLEIKHLTKIRKKIKNWHFGETSFWKAGFVFRSHMKSSRFNLQFLHSLPFQKAGAGTFATWFAGAPVPWAQIVLFFLGVISTRWILFLLGDQKTHKHQGNMEKLWIVLLQEWWCRNHSRMSPLSRHEVNWWN